MNTHLNRHIAVAGAYNIRDLGGIARRPAKPPGGACCGLTDFTGSMPMAWRFWSRPASSP